MPIEITIPRLGWSMEEGTFCEWFKQAGELVRAGEPLFAVESDKVTMDVESLDAGILYVPPEAPQPGAPVTVGQRIGYLLAEGEAPPRAATPVTPRARRAAAQRGVDTSALQGSGRGGRIREQDVLAAAPQQSQPPAPQPQPAPQTIALSPARRTIAQRMMESVRQTAPVTLTRRTDASRLTALRNRWKLALQPGPAPAFHDILIKLAALAIQRHPMLGARWDDGRLALPASIGIALAVDTEHGLFAPVVHDVPALSLEEVAQRTRRLVEAARKRELKAEDLDGAVFTISNLGSFGVEAFTPIIHFPQAAVLGVGAIRWEPVVLPGGQIVAREQMMLSLTFDHRVVDGAPAARFLATIAGLMEEPPPEVHHP